MAKRGELKDVASGLLGSFVSRNNDVDGYWSLGLLRSLADRRGRRTLRLDLIARTAEPSEELVDRLAARYGDMLGRHLARRGIAASAVVEAEVEIEFDTPASIFSSLPTYGTPTRCSVRLLDDRGREQRQSIRTACAPHDPSRESRSRRYP